MKEKMKSFFSDTIWSIAGLMLMNVVAQFVVYPAWSRRLGSENYGDILYLMSILNIVAISMGSGTNYARMTKAADENVSNAPYLVCMMVVTLLSIPFAFIVRAVGGVPMSVLDCILFALLLCATMWRFYADVEYRLSLNYRGYFLYYLVISVGYGIGVLLMNATGLWSLALLPGELFGLLLVALKGKILKLPSDASKTVYKEVTKIVLIMFGTNVISNIVFNGDRILLKVLLDGTAVTTYYLASLLGKTMSLITTPLNSVIVGYLAKYEKGLSKKMVGWITLACAVVSLLVTIACTIASYILIPILYPVEYEMVKVYFFLANLAQVLFFVGNVITVLLLRFADAKYQLYVNVFYAVAFVALCVPATWMAGVWGFCAALLLTCLLRLIYALWLCYNTVKNK